MWTSRRQPADERSEDQAEERFAAERRAMVRTQLAARDITDRRVLEAMQRVPRHKFVETHSLHVAYADEPQPLEHGQTISQPYIVALMTQLAQPEPTDKALDIGTGSGYQAAVLAELCAEVYSIEIVEELAAGARGRLERLGYSNVHVRHGDGYRGWPEQAPFDLIVVAAAPKHIPQPLVDQLAVGGRLVLPVGDWHQTLVVVEKQADGTTRSWKVAPVAFVPMTGEAQRVTP
ncbi:MAG: protein-L-isoaspartate(D-aspartate) O-methyltransferase [Pirellulaceae bacterium]|nr:protein-L-isoaspartate(D-aspartate) O-methyltransferase [Pirellulaceae bacterium]